MERGDQAHEDLLSALLQMGAGVLMAGVVVAGF
jgi:hypothetical protein